MRENAQVFRNYPDLSARRRSDNGWHFTCSDQVQMTDKIVVMPGSARLDLQALKAVAADFGWTVRVAGNVRDAVSAQAVLFYRDALGSTCSWLDAVLRLRRELPDARLIVCHGLSETIDWPQLSDAGA